MAETPTHPQTLPPDMLAALLRTVRRKQQQGDIAGARVVLHALAAQQPNDARIWLVLATIATTRAEQRQALEHAIQIDPSNEPALRALTQLDSAAAMAPAAPALAEVPSAEPPSGPPAPSAEPAVAEPSAAEPISPAPAEPALGRAPALTLAAEAEQARSLRWPLYLVIGVTAILMIILLAVLWPSPTRTAQAPTSTAALPGAQATAPESAAAATQPPIASATAIASAPTAPDRTPATTAAQPTRAAATATPSARPPGAVITQGIWHASLLRPEYAMLLDGSIGTLQPQGRFVLALVAVGNSGSAAAKMPSDLFSLQDNKGNRYTPEPQASSAYLDAYGRGQRGDLSQAEAIPGGGGNVSVPLIFDVPVGAQRLMLHVDGDPLGWPVRATAALPPLPSATP